MASTKRLYARNGIWYGWYYDRHGERVRFSTACTDKQAAATVLAQTEQRETQSAAAGLAADVSLSTLFDGERAQRRRVG